MEAIVVSSFEDWSQVLESGKYDLILLAPPLLSIEGSSVIFATSERAARALHNLDFENANIYPLPASFDFLATKKQMLSLLRKTIDGIVITHKRCRCKKT